MSTPHLLLLLAGLGLTCLACAASDLATRRIPNALLLAGIAWALAVFGLVGAQAGPGPAVRGLVLALTGAGIGCGLLYWSWRLGQVGAGDVKFLMVIGFFLGPIGVVLALLNGALAGGLWALALAWREGGLAHALANIRAMASSLALSGFRNAGFHLNSPGATAMPYGVALAAGALLVGGWQAWTRLAV